MNSKEKAELIAEALLKMGIDDRFKITKNLFNDLDQNEVRSLCGEPVKEWSQFKARFIFHQESLGFNWEAGQGHGGPMSLRDIRPIQEIGEDLASECQKERITEGSLSDVVKSKLPAISRVRASTEIEVDLTDVRDGFKGYTKGNCSYKFKRGAGGYFQLSVKEYEFKSSRRRKSEYDLGELIAPKMRDLFGEWCKHTQSEKPGKKYQNADFTALTRERTSEQEHLSVSAFELKPSNTIAAVSQAISQATNYKSKATYAYVIIPKFDNDSFYDTERLEELLSLCRANGIGVISISITEVAGEEIIAGLVPVLGPEVNEITDFTWLDELANRWDQEKCLLCRKVVNKYERTRCGWLVEDGDTGYQLCMKNGFDNMVIEHHRNSSK